MLSRSQNICSLQSQGKFQFSILDIMLNTYKHLKFSFTSRLQLNLGSDLCGMGNPCEVISHSHFLSYLMLLILVPLGLRRHREWGQVSVWNEGAALAQVESLVLGCSAWQTQVGLLWSSADLWLVLLGCFSASHWPLRLWPKPWTSEVHQLLKSCFAFRCTAMPSVNSFKMAIDFIL